MGTTLTGKRVQNTYDSLLKLSDNDNLTGSPKIVGSGLGTDSPIYLSTTSVGIGISPSVQFQTSGNAQIGNNLVVGGNLTVNGSTTIVDSTIIAIGDNMIELAKDNTANTKDIGWYGTIVESGTKFAGMYYDASSGVTTPEFYIGVGTVEPGSTAAWTTKGKLIIGGLDASGDISVAQTNKIRFDGFTGHTYISEESDSNLKFYVAGVEVFNTTNDFVDFAKTIDIVNLKINGGQGNDGQVLTSTGSGVQWEDASGTIDGSGTANDVVMWQDSDTLTDAPIAISGTKSIFGGDIEVSPSVNKRIRFMDGATFKGGIQLVDTGGQMIATSAANDLAIRSQSNLIFSTGGNTERFRIASSTGLATFENDIMAKGNFLNVAQYIIHINDGDTYHRFLDDRQLFVAGNIEFIDFAETTQNYITLGNSSDVDAKLQGGSGFIFIQGSDGYIGINDLTPTSPLDINGNTAITGTLNITGTISSGDLTITKQNDAPIINLLHDGTNPGVADLLSRIQFQVDYDGSHQNWGRIELDTNASSVRTNMDFYVKSTLGAEQLALRLEGQPSAVPNAHFPGNLGIGLTNPAVKLEIKDSTHTTMKIRSGNDDNIFFAQAIQSQDSRIGTETNTDLSLYTNGSERMRVNNSGNVIIGATTPDDVGGASKLSVDVGTGQGSFRLQNGGTDGVYFRRNTTGGKYQIQTTVGNGNAGVLSLQTYGGDVGIGTLSPARKLEVDFTGSVNGARFTRSDATGSSQIEFANSAGVKSVIGYDAGVDGFKIGTDSATNVVVKSNGSVGIGTTSPAQKVEVVHSGFAYIRLRSTAGSYTGFDIGQHTGGSVFLNNRDNTSIILMTNNTTAVTIDNSQNSTFAGYVKAPFFTSDGGRGFKQDSVAFVSTYSNGADANAVNDIGKTANKWRDAYFSGQVNSATISTTGNATFGGDIQADNIGLGAAAVSFGTGVPTILLKGTNSTNGRAGALYFKENDGTDTAALYVTDGNDGYGTVLTAYQGSLKFATGSLTGTVLTLDQSNNATFNGNVLISSNGDATQLKIKRASANQDNGLQLQDQNGNKHAIFNLEGSVTNNLQIASSQQILFHTSSDCANPPTSERMRITGQGRIGIGTTSPFAPLTVVATGIGSNGTIGIEGANAHVGFKNSSGTFRSWVGHFNATGHGSDADLNLKTGYGSTGNIRFTADGDTTAAQMFLQGSTGRLGIGTTSPSHLLSVGTEGNSSGRKISLYLGGTNENFAGIGAQRGESNLFCSSEIRFINENNSSGLGAFAIATGGNTLTERMRVGSSGNVGIGLTVLDSKLRINNNGGSSYRFGYGGSSDVYLDIRDLYIRSANGNTNLVRFQENGRVGIGTTSPTAQLNLFNAAASGQPMLQVMSHATAAGSFTGNYMVEFCHAFSTVNHGMLVKNRESSDGRRTLDVADANGIFASFTNGKFGLGTTSPSYKLQVNGTAYINETLYVNGATTIDADLTISETNGEINFTSGNGNINTTTGSTSLVFGTGSSERMRIHSTGRVAIGNTSPSYKLDVTGDIRATADVIAFSDARVKENVETIDSALDKVNKLRGVKYNRNDIKDKSKKIGVIAQEVLEVLPEVVQLDDNDRYSVAYGNMAGLFIEAIKELRQEVEELKKQIK